ncbi:MAG: SDR family oxidoreductase [Candidatus Sungbacteria bacterium]|nr:SDR family oxidoreductase [Candidatus Sungbacteria bacterium]
MTDAQTENGKVAAISGGSGYVGSAIARKLAADGMRVALLYHRTPEKTVNDMITLLPGSGHCAYQCDLEDAGQVAETIAKIERDMGQIGISVHAAGIGPHRGSLLRSSSQDLRDQLSVTVSGGFHFLSACALAMKERTAGVIIGITTSAVLISEAGQGLGAYVPAKYALQGMLAMLRQELAPHHVRVYSVAPGFMSGGMNLDIPQAFVDMAREKSPAKKFASADDVADAVSFLCSDHAVHVSNLTLLVAPESGALS